MKATWRSNNHSNVTAGQVSFVESLLGIMLNIFIENERIRLCICIIVEQQYLCIFPEFISFVLVLRMKVNYI